MAETPTPFPLIAVLGPPGAGKGTLSAHLAAKYNLTHHSVGDGLRAWMRENAATPLAAAVRDKLDHQGFLSPEVLDPFVQRAIRDAHASGTRGLLLDGYPRCLEQLRAFDDWDFDGEALPERTSGAPDAVLVVRTAKAVARGRYVARSRDARDSAEKFARRFAEYERETLPVEQVYRERGVLIEIAADGTREETLRELERCVGESALLRGLLGVAE